MKRTFRVVLVLCLLVTCTLALAPAAGALPHRNLALAADETAAPTPAPVSGVWSWHGGEGAATEPAGDYVYIYGYELGDWTGAFQGASYEPYTGWIRSSDGYVWAIITIRFKGTCNGVPGKATMQLTVEEPQSGPNAGKIFGQWAVISGKGALKRLRGAGTWEWTHDEGDHGFADYEGMVWMQ